MKVLFLSLVAASAFGLAGCQTGGVGSADGRTLDLTGTNGRYSVQVPGGDRVVSDDAPYALRGDSQTPARIDFFEHERRGTNGGN
jgi:hypothetical protein